MAMVEAAIGLTFVCSSIAAMLSQVDRHTGAVMLAPWCVCEVPAAACTSPMLDTSALPPIQTIYSAAREGHRTNEQLMDEDDPRVAERIPFEPREYVSRLSPEIAASLPEKRVFSGFSRRQ